MDGREYMVRTGFRQVTMWWPRPEDELTPIPGSSSTRSFGLSGFSIDMQRREPVLTIRGLRGESSWILDGSNNLGMQTLHLMREAVDLASRHGVPQTGGHTLARPFADVLALLADQVWMRWRSRVSGYRNKLVESELYAVIALMRAPCYPVPEDTALFSPAHLQERAAHVAMLPIGAFSVQRYGEDAGPPREDDRQALLSLNGQHCVIREIGNEFESGMIQCLVRDYGTRRDKLQDFWWLAAEYADYREGNGDLESTYLDLLRSGIRPLPWSYGIP